MAVSFASANFPHPSSSPCGADVSSILTDPKATHTRKHHLGPCFSCACACVCVGCVICAHKSIVCISECNCVCVICVYECIFIHLCVCVFLLVIEGVRGSIWCCGQTVRRTCVRVCFQFFFFFLEAPWFVCACVCVCLLVYIPPTWTGIPRWALPVAGGILWKIGYTPYQNHTFSTRSILALPYLNLSLLPWCVNHVLCLLLLKSIPKPTQN